MLLSRGVSTLKGVKLFLKPVKYKNQVQQASRQSHHWYYRIGAPRDKKAELTAEILQGLAWWWVLWHLWVEPEHVTGEFPYPDPSKWTDEELGIPS